MPTFVIAKDGSSLMPTFNPKKVRLLLKTGRAKIFKYEPFTIQLQYESTTHTQPIEYKTDTGYLHVGISICSAKHEYVSEQRDLLADEVIHHDNCRRQYRRSRRFRKRYRKPRFDNRTASKKSGWLAPSLRNKRDVQIQLLQRYASVMPVSEAYFECGTFDTQVLKAVADNQSLPNGKDYQHGERYGYDTLREAVFARDNYTCICCGSNPFSTGTKQVILQVHHLGFRNEDRTNRMSNLATVCTKCHTSKNHKPGGKLYDLKPKLKTFKGAAFMTAVRFQMITKAKELLPYIKIHMCYGAATKRTRLSRRIKKSHANDAYCIGTLYPKHRTVMLHFQKRRRNNRILEKFYDATYIDIRTGEKKKASAIGCNRTKRGETRHTSKNERIYRGTKMSSGYRSIRTKRYPIQSGDIVWYMGRRYVTGGMHNKGKNVTLPSIGKSVSAKKVTVIKHVGGWKLVA